MKDIHPDHANSLWATEIVGITLHGNDTRCNVFGEHMLLVGSDWCFKIVA